MKYALFAFFFTAVILQVGHAQKVPLDHTVYDHWQDIGKMDISCDGRYIYYEVPVQKGNGTLYLQMAKGDTVAVIPRGEAGSFTIDGQYFICRIAAPYEDKADIKHGGGLGEEEKSAQTARKAPKRKIENNKKFQDSLWVFDLANRTGVKYPGLKGSYKLAGLKQNWLIWLSDSENEPDSLDILATKSALTRVKPILKKIHPSIKLPGVHAINKEGIKQAFDKKEADYTLHIWPLGGKAVEAVPHTTSFVSDTISNYIAITRRVGAKLDSQSIAYRYLTKEEAKEKADKKGNGKTKNLGIIGSGTILSRAKEIKSVVLTSSKGTKQDDAAIAFIATGVNKEDSLGKENDIYIWQLNKGLFKAVSYKDASLPPNWEVSPYTELEFSRSGNRLFFDIAPAKPAKDTSEGAADVEIWHTNSEVLFTERRASADRYSKKGYLTVYFLHNHKVLQIEDSVFSDAMKTYKGDGRYFYVATDSSRRIAKQWLGYTRKDFYALDMEKGIKKKVVTDVDGRIYPSFTGDQALVYDKDKRQYAFYNAVNQKLSTVKGCPYPLYDELDDRTEVPSNYGVLGWDTVSHAAFVYDRYDIWRIDPDQLHARLVNQSGRQQKIQTRLYLSVPHRGPHYFNGKEKLNFDCYHEQTKNNQFIRFAMNKPTAVQAISLLSGYKALGLKVARNNPNASIYTLENYQESPQIYSRVNNDRRRISNINAQQNKYVWGTANLFKWKAYTGKQTQGIVYLPEDLDTTKKYPMITYFYERRNETLFKYVPPKPTGSALNISFFVSRGYIVFIPDIWYTAGHPGQSAYDYVVSGVKALQEAYPCIDTSRMGMQGQSWGGYQVAYLVTRTSMFKAAWAGAPVVDMFSAYGGIRWKTGSSRAMQYEKGQSRIGATPWENKGLYIENSPLFFIPKIQTPLVIMSNDGDGAVPWYQGIEFFMALRRFGKQAWLLNYRGEEHNLIKRPNKIDIQRKEAAFFDWQLKGAPRPAWTR